MLTFTCKTHEPLRTRSFRISLTAKHEHLTTVMRVERKGSRQVYLHVHQHISTSKCDIFRDNHSSHTTQGSLQLDSPEHQNSVQESSQIYVVVNSLSCRTLLLAFGNRPLHLVEPCCMCVEGQLAAHLIRLDINLR